MENDILCKWNFATVLLFKLFLKNCYCSMFYLGMDYTLDYHHLGTLLSNNNQSVYLLNNDGMYDFRNILSVCKDSSASSVMYGLSITPCFPESDPTLMYTKYLKLPSLSITETCNVNNSYQQVLPDVYRSPYSINRRFKAPDPSVVIGDIALKGAWVECIIIVDDKIGVYPQLDRLLSYLGHLAIRISLFTVTSKVDIFHVMTRIDAWKSAEYTVPTVLLCTVNNTLQILEQRDSIDYGHFMAEGISVPCEIQPFGKASALGMRRTEYMWVIYNGGGTKDILPYLQPSDNVALVLVNHNIIEAQIEEMYENIVVLNKQISKTVAEHSEPPMTSKRTCKSGISDSLRTKITSQLNEYSRDLKNLTSEPVYEVQSSITRKSGVPEMEKVATWDMNNSLQLPSSLFPNAFNGFNQRVFTVSSVEYSFFQKKIISEDGNVTWVGLTFQLLDELAKELNFRYIVVETGDKQWGLRVNSSTGPKWNGMIGQVVAKEVDFAAACFSITAERDEVVDFPSPYFHDQSVVVMKRPDDQNRLLLYMLPFTGKVWLGTIAAIVLCGPLLWLMTYFSPFYKVNGNPWCGRKGLMSLQNSMFYIFGAFLQQGGVFLPMAQSGRVLVAFYWVFTIVIVATYTGNLIAFLAVSTVDMPFDTLSQMVQQDRITWGTATGVALVMLFRDANFDPYTKVYQKMDPVDSYSEGLRRVKEENYAFISEKSWYQAEAALDKDCILAMMKEEFYPTSYGWALQAGAPYLSLFSDKINKIRESGLLDKWIQDWTPKNIHCKGLGPTTQTKVATVIDFQGALYLLVLGVGIAILFLLGELGYHGIIRVIRRHNINNNNTRSQSCTTVVQNGLHNGHGMNQVNSTSSGLDLLNTLDTV